MRVYTRTGDDGSTALGDGRRVSKAAARVAAYGDVDELNAVLGALRAEVGERSVGGLIERAQRALFEIGAFLADPSGRFDLGTDVSAPVWLEEWIDEMEADLEPLRRFILPGGTRAAALGHLGRTVCRRAERGVVALAAEDVGGCGSVIPFLNRLSDTLFVLARWLNRTAGTAETVWPGRR